MWTHHMIYACKNNTILNGMKSDDIIGRCKVLIYGESIAEAPSFWNPLFKEIRRAIPHLNFSSSDSTTVKCVTEMSDKV